VDFGLAQRLSKSESSEQQSVNGDVTSEQNGRLLLEAVTDKQVVIFTFFPSEPWCFIMSCSLRFLYYGFTHLNDNYRLNV